MEEDFPPDEEYDRQCGEIFLTIKGDLLVHCTLCETRYKGFQQYAEHVKLHCKNEISEREGKEFLIFESVDKRSDDSFHEYDGFEDEDVDVDVDFFSSNQENEQTAGMFVENEELQFNLNIDDDFFCRNGEDENLLANLDDKPKPQPFKYRFNASRRPKSSQTDKPIKKERKHHCSKCNYSCVNRSNLVAHMNRHSSFKPHECDKCAKRFHTRSELLTHIRSHTGERPFLCSECGKGFITSSKLCLHLKSHRIERDKDCPFCSMKFYSHAALKTHVAVHEMYSDMPLKNTDSIQQSNGKYECDICMTSFKQKSKLNAHKKSEHGTIETKNYTDSNEIIGK